MPTVLPFQAFDLFPAESLLTTVLDLSPNGIALCTPVYDEAGTLADMALAYLNPAAQRLLHLPAQPAATFTQHFAGSHTDGSWAVLRDAFLAHEPSDSLLVHASGGPPQRLHLTGQRVGGGLLLNLLEAPAPPAAAVPAAELASRLAEHSQQLGLFDAVLGSLQEFVYLFDLDGRFRYVNQPLLDLWGLTLEQAVGKNFFDLEYPPPLAAQLHAQIQQAATTQQPVTGETAYTSPTGETGEYEYTFVPLLSPDGAVEAVAGRTQPVTERRRADAALRASEAQYRTLFETMDEGFCLIELLFDDQQRPTDYRFLEVNPAFEQQTGLVNAPGRTILELTPQLEQQWFDIYGAVALTGKPVRFEQQAEPLQRWFEVYAFRVGKPDQHRVAVLFNNISPSKQAQELVRRSEERLQKALSIDTVGVLFFDLAGGIHDSNAAFERMSGYPRAELAHGQAYLDALTAPAFIPATHRAIEQLRTTGESTPFEKQYLRPDGSRWWGLSAGKRLSETECVKFVLDITEAKQAEAALRHSQQLLQHTNEQLTRTNIDLDNFIYTASHDLKSPITNIEGLLYELQAHLPPQVQQTYEVAPLLTMMQGSVARFRRTIDHLSDITKLQKEHNQLITEVLLLPVIEDVCQDLQPLIKATGARLEVDVAACPSVLFSLKDLRSVVYNLLSNAVKYGHPDRPPQVRIYCYPSQVSKHLVLCVQDNGLGIKESRYPELFAMFRRLHNHVEGSGIGLYMVKRIVENVGGHIEVHSQLNVGTTFSVHLPYAAEPDLA